jgi:hypothetical protein
MADEGELEFQSMHKQENNFTSSIEDLECNLTICKQLQICVWMTVEDTDLVLVVSHQNPIFLQVQF